MMVSNHVATCARLRRVDFALSPFAASHANRLRILAKIVNAAEAEFVDARRSSSGADSRRTRSINGRSASVMRFTAGQLLEGDRLALDCLGP
jgi:hypothetical protein